MTEILSQLEEIAKLAKTTSDKSKIEAALRRAQTLVKAQNGSSLLKELAHELETWISKIDVITKEPVGRQGMAKHAMHWVEQLKKGS